MSNHQTVLNEGPGLKVIVLRWGHRPRDFRVTSHVALTARAFGASGLVLSDIEDKTLDRTVKNITRRWGGTFDLEMNVPWRSFIKSWREIGGVIVHLTVYGENIESSNVIQHIRDLKKDVLVLVGSQKVPSDFYSEEVSDFNVAVGNQPHSEIAALSVFLDRLFEGKELNQEFKDAKVKIWPSKRGKKIISK